MKKLEKSISNKLKLGKYSLFEILIPLIALLSVFMVKWENLVGNLEWVVRGFIILFSFEFWKIINKLKKKRVRSYKAHWLIKIGFTHLKHFSNKNQFIG
jgi:hypothetical protein